MSMRKRSGDTRETIISSVRDLFISSGYSAATMSDIADRADTTKKTLYGYFPDKRTLFLSVIQHSILLAQDDDEKVDDILSIEQMYSSLFEVAKKLNDVFSNSDYIELLRVIISEINLQPELKDALENGVTRRSLRSLTSIFESAQNNKVGILKDPTSTARMFVGGFVINAYLSGLLEPSPGKLHKLSEAELHHYVNDFIPMAVISTQQISKCDHSECKQKEACEQK